jgi:hypothetical protein
LSNAVKPRQAKGRYDLLYQAARFFHRFATDPHYRSVTLLRWKRPRELFQPYIVTGLDRYPALFGFAREQLSSRTHLKILSFGCSTGEEVVTLRQYFPHAAIKGIDINPYNIATSRARQEADAKVRFEVAGTTRAEPAETYDAIFCLAVLRHGKLNRPKIRRCDHLIRFGMFEETIADFARCIKAGGLLFIAHSNFRLADTAVSDQFEVAYEEHSPDDLATPIFDRKNERLSDSASGIFGFRKRRTAG